VRILGTFQDITPQKELERSLQEALGRAEAGARAKSEFLAVMSHELRTPLNGVLGFSEILAGTPLDADQKVYADTIRESGEHLLAVVNDILDFSSFERGAVGLHNAPFDTARLVRSAMESIAKAAADKDLDVRLEQSPAVPARITGDARRAGQVLNNLLANAVKFTARGSVVLRVAPSTHAGVPCVDFAVEDTGIGISPASIDNLFRAFTQADSSSRRAFGGTGLGLAIARRLSEAMGGEITVVSAPERGSTFTFHLPLAPAAAPPSGPISRPSQERGDCWSL
jgi:signal transduction histidine kinase